MNLSSERQHKELSAYLLAVFDECQQHPPESSHCPLYSIKQMKPAQRAAWLHALHPSELEYLASYHHVCLQTAWFSNLADVSALRSTHPPTGGARPNQPRAGGQV